MIHITNWCEYLSGFKNRYLDLLVAFIWKLSEESAENVCGEGTSLSRSTICVYSSTLCSVNLKNHKEKKKTPRGQSRAALHSLILFIFPSSNRLHSFCLILYIAALHLHFFTRSVSHVPITCPFPVKLSFCLLYLWGHKTRQLIESTLHVTLWLIASQSDAAEGVAAVNQFTSEETNYMVESICLYNIDYHFLKKAYFSLMCWY